MNKILTLLAILLAVATLQGLTLQEAKQMALKNNSRYLAQQHSYKAAQWSKQQALSGLFPSLTLSGTYLYLDPATTVNTGAGSITLNQDNRSAALTLSQPIFMGGKLWQAYRLNSISAELAALSLENMRLSILNDVESKFLSVLQLQELLAIAQKDLKSSQQNLTIAEVRYQTGLLSQADLLRIQARVASKEVALLQAETALELARQDLMNNLALYELDELELPPEPTENNVLAVLSEMSFSQTENFIRKALDYAARNNLSLKTAAGAVKLSGKAYNIARGSFLPTVVLSASRNYKENGIDRYEFDASHTIALSASVPLLPLWNNYAASRKAYYDLQKGRQDYQTAEDGINLAVKSSALNLISSARQIKAALTALQYTEQSYQQLMERYRANLLSVTEMLEAEVMLQSAGVGYTNALYNYLKARSALLQNMGTDNEKVLSDLIR